MISFGEFLLERVRTRAEAERLFRGIAKRQKREETRKKGFSAPSLVIKTPQEAESGAGWKLAHKMSTEPETMNVRRQNVRIGDLERSQDGVFIDNILNLVKKYNPDHPKAPIVVWDRTDSKGKKHRTITNGHHRDLVAKALYGSNATIPADVYERKKK